MKYAFSFLATVARNTVHVFSYASTMSWVKDAKDLELYRPQGRGQKVFKRVQIDNNNCNARCYQIQGYLHAKSCVFSCFLLQSQLYFAVFEMCLCSFF